MVLKSILLAVIGFSSGVAVASGIFALISVLGILPRLLDVLNLGQYTYVIETVIMLGGTIGSIATIYPFPIYLGVPFLGLFGLFAGIFVGSLAMALAETLKVIPILCRRLKFKTGIVLLITALALGKGFGAFYQLFIMGGK